MVRLCQRERPLTHGETLLVLTREKTLQTPIAENAPQTGVIAQRLRQGFGLIKTVEGTVKRCEGNEYLT
jgi:hypothetical protein